MATENGSVISASLFGVLAGSGALPFSRQAFEDAIRRSGKGVEASLKAFDAGFDIARTGGSAPDDEATEDSKQVIVSVQGPSRLSRKWDGLNARVASLPKAVQDMTRAGLQAVVDYQGVDYGKEYLDRLSEMMDLDGAKHDWELSREAAKYIARAMAYDDVIRVADLKTRRSRFDRVQNEIRPDNTAVMHVTEFMHPRAEEIVGLLPAKLGARLEKNPKRIGQIDRMFNKGRRVRSSSLVGFAMLYFLGGLRRWRLKTLRHSQEQAHLNAWLAKVRAIAPDDYALAVEVLRCRRLIKGYSDTHARGQSKFDRVLAALELLSGRDDAADWLRRLCDAALQDEDSKALDGALQTIASFVK